LNNFEPKIQIKFTKIQRLPTNLPKVRFRFEPLYNWLNLELDLGFGSAKTLNLELNFGFGPRGSGSNLGSEPNFGITISGVRDAPVSSPHPSLVILVVSSLCPPDSTVLAVVVVVECVVVVVEVASALVM
jgi:hypothetical protein